MGFQNLPTTVKAALSTLTWSLDLSSLPPMYFQPLNEISSLRTSTDLTPEASNIAKNIPETISTLGGSDYAKVAVGLLLLGNGGTDECHNLVTPLSWPEETHFGYGIPSNSEAVVEASYAHSLVHRKEGPNVGEFGMVGWSNANYWTNVAMSRCKKMNKNDDNIPLDKIRNKILALASATQNYAAIKWCHEHHVDEYWEPRALHQLCAQVVAGRPEANGLKQFASDAAVLELRILTEHCLNKAGFEID